MKKFLQTAKSVVASMASYIIFQVAFACALLLLPFIANAQAAQTSIEREGQSNQYQLVFHQDPDAPVSLAGVEYYVVVSGSSPTIALSVPNASWLFDPSATTITVGSPVVTGTTYKFPIYVWRNDEEPQDGDGLYLEFTLTDGIAIVVEDFPGKSAPQTSVTYHESSVLESLLSTAQEVSVWALDGRLVQFLTGDDLAQGAAKMWRNLESGIYIVDGKRADQRHTYLKVKR